jgi:uncharacterized protein (TIGR02646 family)
VHFGAPDWETKEATEETRFKFRVYQRPAVKAALRNAFGGLCAYCETYYLPGSPGAAEHYRPKGAVDTETQRGRKPGYYWLAATWENLLPSCERCNTAERHEHGDGTVRTSGKGNAFPLEDEISRATMPGDETHERPLLLHPYYDEPDAHLEFVEEGYLRPRNGSPKGRTTIDVLGLNRTHLLNARRDRLTVLEAALTRIEKLAIRMDQYPADASFRADHETELAELERMLKPGQVYSALVAQRVGASA